MFVAHLFATLLDNMALTPVENVNAKLQGSQRSGMETGPCAQRNGYRAQNTATEHIACLFFLFFLNVIIGV